MKKETYLILTLIFPILMIYLLLIFTKDAVITIYVGSVLCYILPCHIYDRQISEFKWSWFTGEETSNFIDKLCHGIEIKFKGVN